jgi:hypothetical protein
MSNGLASNGKSSRRMKGTAALLALASILLSVPAALAAPEQREIVSAPAPGDNFGYSVSVSGTTAIVGAPGAFRGGGAYIYLRAGRHWQKQAVLVDPPNIPDDSFGYSVAVSGSVAVVGAWGTRKHAGAAYIYARSGGRWHRQARLADPAPGTAAFGYSVTVSGSTVLIGTFSAGRAYVYGRSDSRWHRQATLVGPAGSSVFGGAVAISGSTAVVGAWGTDDQAGAAYIYAHTPSGWRLRASIPSPGNGSLKDHFASAVAVSGETVVIGAPAKHDGIGAAFIYGRSGSEWRRHAALRAPLQRANDNFGYSVAVSTTKSGLRVVIGAPSTGNACGAAYEMVPTRNHWRKRATIVGPTCSPENAVGFSVSVSAKLAIIGAPGENDTAGEVFALDLL